MHFNISELQWAILAQHKFMHTHIRHKPMSLCRFCSCFGITPIVCSWYWHELDRKGLLPDCFRPKYFLWTLHFLKCYNTEEQNSMQFSCSEPTYRKWVWTGINLISFLDLVCSTVCLYEMILPINILIKSFRLSGKLLYGI